MSEPIITNADVIAGFKDVAVMDKVEQPITVRVHAISRKQRIVVWNQVLTTGDSWLLIQACKAEQSGNPFIEADFERLDAQSQNDLENVAFALAFGLRDQKKMASTVKRVLVTRLTMDLTKAESKSASADPALPATK